MPCSQLLREEGGYAAEDGRAMTLASTCLSVVVWYVCVGEPACRGKMTRKIPRPTPVSCGIEPTGGPVHGRSCCCRPSAPNSLRNCNLFRVSRSTVGVFVSTFLCVMNGNAYGVCVVCAVAGMGKTHEQDRSQPYSAMLVIVVRSHCEARRIELRRRLVG